MGCCSSHAMDAKADASAAWTEEEPCQCRKQFSITTKLIWKVVPITTGCCCSEEVAAREVVQATIKCGWCHREFRRTYELRYHEKRKCKRWGYYGKLVEVQGRSAVQGRTAQSFSFAHLEQCYALMEQSNKNNNDWADEFYQLVTAGKPKCENENENCKV